MTTSDESHVEVSSQGGRLGSENPAREFCLFADAYSKNFCD
jgi:hypothetical protein